MIELIQQLIKPGPAVKLAQPFPPVPDEIAKQTLAINGQFKYQIVSGLVNQFLR